jgi:predicted branched-subunit amino acid permease
MREQAEGRRDGAFILGSGLALYVNWVAATALGHEMGGHVTDIRAWGIDFVVPAFCASLLAGAVRQRRDLTPCLVGGVVAALMALFVPGHWHVLVGGIAGSLAGLAQRDD